MAQPPHKYWGDDMAYLELTNIQKRFADSVAVENFTLQIDRGEFVSFLGPSGCGKTTTLRMVAGFETPTSGTIVIDGVNVTGLRPSKRNIGMVFQQYALFPNMNVADNIGFGLRVAGRPAAEIHARVAEMLDIIRMTEFAKRSPVQLSGGQQQRVALARALAMQPRVLLLDEPLSALDAKIRVTLRDEIRAIQRRLAITTIYVTHDQEEAMAVSDRIVVMSRGQIEQVGPPATIYNFPRTSFVATFVGQLNQLQATVLDPAQGRVAVEGQPIVVATTLDDRTLGEPLQVALRPEVVSINDASDTSENQLQGTVEEVTFLGPLVRLHVRVGAQVLRVDRFNGPQVQVPVHGASVVLRFAPASCLVMADDGVVA